MGAGNASNSTAMASTAMHSGGNCHRHRGWQSGAGARHRVGGYVTPWLAPLVVFAFLQYVLDSRFLHRQKQLRMSKLGRWNGVFYFVPSLVCALAMLLPDSLAGITRTAAYWIAWALVLSTLLSILDRALARPAFISSAR
jgi:hypothetical protein